MAINETNTAGNTQAIGTAVIVSGPVQVESPDGTMRILQVNGLVFADETIITGGNGKVSIIFNDADHTQLDLGRMSEVVLDGDVYPGEQDMDLADVVSEVEQLQEALLQGDPTTDLPAPAAGPAAGGAGVRGGGHPVAVFDLTGAEVTPTSGAETIGISRSFLDPERLIGEELLETKAVVEPPGENIVIQDINYTPQAGDFNPNIDEADFADGTHPITDGDTTSGTLADLDVDFGGDGPGYLQFGTQTIDIDNLGAAAGDTFITVNGIYGTLTVWDNGDWSYTAADNIFHPLPDTIGAADSLPDLFPFTVFDSNGDQASGNLTIDIWDDGPIATSNLVMRVVEEEALDNYLSGDPDVVGSDGNADENDGPEDSDFNSLYQNDVAQVNGSLAPLVTMGADNPGTFSWGSLLDLPSLSSQGGQVVYELNANGTTLEAWVHHGMPARISSDFDAGDGDGDRLVFTLDLQPDGSYVFTLLDQLDHVAGEGENTALLLWGDGSGSVPGLDLSSAIIATDTDFDSTGLAPGALSFLIVDDVPVLVPNVDNEGGMAFGWVNEDGLNHDTGDGSNNPDEDYSLGNEDGWDSDQTVMNLSGLVKVGTDEGLTWSIADTMGADSGLTSNNAPVYYHLVEGVLVATTSATAPTSLAQAESDGNIFTFSVDEYGNATFNLNDQLDHGDPGVDGIYGTADDAPVGDTGTLTIDNLGQFVVATDFDGDSVDLSGRVNITVENDVPRLVPVQEPETVSSTESSRAPVENGYADMAVQEDALGHLVGETGIALENSDDTDASLGNIDGPADTDQATYNLSALVETGADEELTWSLIPQDEPVETSLLSGGETVFYAVTGNTLTAYTSVVSSVFTFTVDAHGQATFNLNDQLDHPDASGDEAILNIDNLGQFVRATDSDGDYVDLDGRIRIDVENDAPEIVDASVEGMVEESALSRNPLFAWEFPDFWNGDNSEGNSDTPLDFLNDVAAHNWQSDGSLTQLVAEGADEPVTFGLTTDAVSYMEGLGLSSQGRELQYETHSYNEMTFLTATAGTDSVFTLWINENGNWGFDLDDQLDHVDDDSNSQNTDLRSGDGGSVPYIDLSGAIMGTDQDGDPILFGDSQFYITVEDDIPAAVCKPCPIRGEVHEDGLSLHGLAYLVGTESDSSEGNREPGETTLTDEDFDRSNSLTNLFRIGADDNLGADAPPISIGIATDSEYLNNNLASLTSQGDALSYSSDGTTLTATAGSGTEERVVFTLTVRENGNWYFDLDDQLDHVDNGLNNENWNLEGSNHWSGGIDFSAIITAEDFDGDVVSGAAPGSFVIRVQDDVPILAGRPVSNTVDEDNLDTTLSTGTDGGDPGYGPPVSVTGSLAALVLDGADEDITFSLTLDDTAKQALTDQGLESQDDALSYRLTNNGSVLLAEATNEAGETRIVFGLELTEDGAYRFLLRDQLDHPDGDGENTLTIDLSAVIVATDYDGDSVNMADFASEGPAFSITVIDDVPEAVCRPCPIRASVHEDGLSIASGDVGDLSEGNRDFGEDTSDDEDSGNTGSLTHLFRVGADEGDDMEAPELSMGITTDQTVLQSFATGLNLSSQGQSLSYASDGTTLTATSADGRAIFHLTVNEDGSWNFDLDDQLDHVDDLADDENWDLEGSNHWSGGIDFSSLITAEDFDGDVATGASSGSFVVSVQDDVPEVGDPQFAILANEAGNNLVADLAIDIGADEPGVAMTLNPFYNGEIVGEGAVVYNNEGEAMKYQGETLTWHQNSNGSWTAVAEVPTEPDPGTTGIEAASLQGTATTVTVEVFTVELEESSPGVYTGNYTVELHRELDGSGREITEEFTLAPPYGPPEAEKSLTSNSGNIVMTFTAVNPAPDGSFDDVVNWNADGIGVGNTFINEDDIGEKGETELVTEQLIINYTDSNGDQVLMNTATFTLSHLDEHQQGASTGPEIAIWTAYGYDENGDSVELTGQVTGYEQGGSWQTDKEVTIDFGTTGEGFYQVIFTSETANSEGYRVTPEEATYEEGADHTVTFVVDGEDYDGDAFDQQTFDVTFDGEGDIVGTDADEVIAGSTGNDVINGGEGDDVIDGGEGDDTIFGGEGDDTIDGGEGDDEIFGEEGSDVIDGEEGDDTLLGGAEDPPATPSDPPEEGNDSITGGEGADTFDTTEEGADEVEDYAPEEPPVGENDELDDLIPPVTP